MQKLDKLHEAFMNSTDKKKDALETRAIKNFDEVYKLVSEKYMEKVLEKVEEAKSNRMLTGKKLAELENLTNRGRSLVDREFIDRVSRLINPKASKQTSRLLCTLAVEGKLEEAREYEIVKVQAGDVRTYVYKKQGAIVGTDEYGIDAGSSLGADEDFDIEFNLELGEYEEEIIKQFDSLRNKVLDRDPYAEIKIMERLIIVEDRRGERCYMIQNGKIVPAKVDEKEKIKINLDHDRRELPAIHKDGMFSKIQKAIRKKLFRNPSEGTIYNGGEQGHRTKQRNFRNEVSDMSNYIGSNGTTSSANGREERDRER